MAHSSTFCVALSQFALFCADFSVGNVTTQTATVVIVIVIIVSICVLH